MKKQILLVLCLALALGFVWWSPDTAGIVIDGGMLATAMGVCHSQGVAVKTRSRSSSWHIRRKSFSPRL